MNNIFIILVALICFISCNTEQIITDVKLVANDEFVKDARLFIDGRHIENFSHLNESESLAPCINLSDNFPSISLTSSPTSVGKSFYDFLILSKDYKYQHEGTKIIEDGICQKWELETRQFKPIVDERFDVQNIIKVNDNDLLIKVSVNDEINKAVLNVILNDESLVSNYIGKKEAWEENIRLDEGMNFIGIESIVEGQLNDLPVLSIIEIFDGIETHTLEIQSYNEQPAGLLITSYNL